MKIQKYPKKFVIAIANRTEAHIFCDEMLGVERAFRRGIKLDQMYPCC